MLDSMHVHIQDGVKKKFCRVEFKLPAILRSLAKLLQALDVAVNCSFINVMHYKWKA